MAGEFLDSFALIGADGRLIYWDDGFAQEFQFAGARLKPGATYAEVARAASEEPRLKEFLLEKSGFSDIDSLLRHGLEGFGQDRSEEYRTLGDRIILVHHHRTASGDIRRFGRDVTAEMNDREGLTRAYRRLDATDAGLGAALTETRRMPDGNYFYQPIDEALRRLLDFPAEYVGQDAIMFFARMKASNEEHARIFAQLEDSAQTLVSIEQDYNIRDGNDRMRWVRHSMMPRREADGTVIFSGVMRDVTREKEAEDALAEAQHRLDAVNSDEYGVLIETRRTPDGSYIFQPIAEGLCRLLDLPPELAGQDPMLIYSRFEASAEDNAKANALMEHGARTLDSFSLEFRIRDGKNRMRWLRQSMMPRREADGTVVFSGVIRDVTRQKDAEDQVDLLRSVVVRSSDAVVIFKTAAAPERGTRILYVNAKFTELYGGSVESHVGQSMEALTNNDFKRMGAKLLSAALKRDDGLPFEYQAVGADGRVFWVEVRVQTVQKLGDGGVRWVVISRDVSERRLALEELRCAKEDAEASNRAKGDFLANMSHELRTPLNAIIGFTELIEQGVARNGWSPSYLEYLGDVSKSGRHLLDLINTILDLSKIEAGQLELNRSAVDLCELTETSFALVSGMAHDSGITISTDIPSECPEIQGDYLKLKQVLLNVVSNAIKFTPPGGTISAKLSFTETEAVIAVADTGCGIKAADLGRVTQPFVQVENALSRKFGGSGLGLSIARELCRLHGGALEIDSIEGAGTTVRIVLPRTEEPIKSRTARSPRPIRTSPRIAANGAADRVRPGISARLAARPRSASP